jgi:hypothetical protein
MLLLGDSSELQASTYLHFFRVYLSTLITIALTGLILLIALALAIALRNDREYLALCIFLAADLYYTSLTLWNQVYHQPSTRWGGGVPFALTTMVSLVAGLEFARLVLKLRRTRWIAAYEWTVSLTVVLYRMVVFDHPDTNRIFLFALFGGILLCISPLNVALPLYALWRWYKTRSFDALLLSLPLLVRGLYFVGFVIFFLLGLAKGMKPGGEPLVPMPFLLTYWSEVTNFFFLLAVLLFLILRTVRVARAQASSAAEIAAAQTTQQLLLSRSSHPTPGFAVESVYLPASQVGGDFSSSRPTPPMARSSPSWATSLARGSRQPCGSP